MQTMEMGPAEAALTQMSAIPSASSSSYFLQLDPSGQVDILESSLVLSKPDMADETVYEIQLDPFMMDERNVEIINLQNLQNTVTFQPEFLDEHQFATTFDSQVHYQVDEFNLNQLLINAAAIPAQTMTTEIITNNYDDQPVPDFTVETEVSCDAEQLSASGSVILSGSATQNVGLDHQNHSLEYISVHGEPDASDKQGHESINLVSGDNATPTLTSVVEVDTKGSFEEQDESTNNEEIMDVNDEEDSAIPGSESSPEGVPAQTTRKVVKRDLPDNIMEFTEEAVMPPVIEIFPSSTTNDPPALPPVVTLCDEEYDDDDEVFMDDSSLQVSKFLYDGIDPDDELYISYLSRPDETKTAMCILCYEWFDNSSDLDEHLKSVHQNNMTLYGCKRCGKKFWARFLRQRHEKQHRYDLKGPIQRYLPKNRPFDHYESKHFYKRLRPAPFTEKYRDHIRLIHAQIKSAEYDCIQCNKIFQSEEELREHYDEEHAVQTCIHCRKLFENSKVLRMHEQEVHGSLNINKNYPGGAWKLWENWDCDEMKERDDRLVNLYLFHNYTKRTKRDHIGEETSSSICDKFTEFGCEEITVSEFEAPGNFEKANPVEKEKRTTSNKQGNKPSSTGKHSDTPKSRKTEPKVSSLKLQGYDKIEFVEEPKQEPLVKLNDLPFKCDACKTSFDNDIDLQRHVKSHSIRTMAYMCQYCGRGFATHSNRKEHERIHTGDKPYVCPNNNENFEFQVCSRAFVQISNLKKHIQTHKDKNNLQCSTCNKQFVKESSLILHQRAHSQDRKFRCHICDRAYNYASLLKRHMRIHTGENPYSCEDCGMQFHELVSLHYHRKKVHTGERPHRCEQCGRAFILSSDLKKHLKIHLRDGNSIKSTGTPATTKSKSGSSRLPVVNENPAASANANGAIGEFLAPPNDSNLLNQNSQIDEDYVNPSMIALQADESGDMPEQTATDRILVVSESDLLNVTANEAKMDGVMHQESAPTIDHETNIPQLCNTDPVP